MNLKTNKCIGFFALLLFSLSFFACKKNNESISQDASQLYTESKQLINEYIGKLKQVTDTASVDSLNLEFEKRYEKINFSVSRGTDLLLTEAQNDTLSNLTKQYTELLKKIRTHQQNSPDTINPKSN